MTKLLIVENESSVQAGIRSMLDLPNLNIEVCRIAKDGKQAFDFIEKYSPEIVITDIKMPGLDGFQLMQMSREQFGSLPVFIILTNQKDFHLLKEAMKYQVVDYLLKPDLNQETLMASILKAQNLVKEIEKHKNSFSLPSFSASDSLYDKFFIKLLLNLFENEEQIYLQANELHINFASSSYAVSHCEIVDYARMSKASDKNRGSGLYYSIVHMIREIAGKYILCYVLSLDTKHFSIIFCIDEKDEKNYKLIINNILDDTFSMVHHYYNVSILTSIGSLCHSPRTIAEAYQDARHIFSDVSIDTPILFYDDVVIDSSTKNVFNMSLFREDIKKAFKELDVDSLTNIFERVIDMISTHQTNFLQSIDAACNILFLTISLLPNGESIVSVIFKDDPDGYRSIYKLTSVAQVVNWLFLFRNGLCSALLNQSKAYKNPIVANVKRYISLHINEKLSLPAIASIYGISANYLSNLFRKYNDVGFSEYITQLKIQKAKHLMENSNLKIYEIADRMGFESAFYFSKVFKKVEGISPRTYLQNKLSH